MAVIQNTYTGDGSTVLFSFTFEYLNDTEVRVSVNGVNTTEFTLVNATTVQMNTAPANGALVRIYRVTDIEEPIVTYNAGSAIRARDLNDNESQLLNAVQELDAYSVFADGSKPLAGDLDANGYQISNLATPTSSTDAANKDYVDSVIATGAANAAAAAVSAADAAASAADAAASFDAFDDRFLGAKASEPSVDNDGNALVTGALYFNTATNIARVYNGSYWENVAQPQSVTRWIKTAAGGETSLSGNDDNTFSLAYKAGAEQIFLNGAHLTRGVDYVATDGTTVTGLAALTAGDVVEVLSVNDYIYGTVPDGSVTNAKVAAGAAIASSKLSFTQAGTGAVARSVDSKLKDVVSVKDFGAVGDGVTDDTAAINAAIASTANTIYFPPGTYRVTSTINLRNKRIDAEGASISGNTENIVVILGGNSLSVNNPVQNINSVTRVSGTTTNPVVRIMGAKNQWITVQRCTYIQVYADTDSATTSSTAYSSFWFNYVNTLELNTNPSPSGSTVQWINENVFNLNRINTLVVSGTYLHNNNKFLNGSFEIGAITFNTGSDNRVEGIRGEGDVAVTFGAAATKNVVLTTWQSSGLDFSFPGTVTDNGQGNYVGHQRWTDAKLTTLAAFNYKNLKRLSDARYNVSGVSNVAIGSSSFTVAANAVLYDSGIIPCTGAALMFTATLINRISGGFRVRVLGYDANKVLIPGTVGDWAIRGVGGLAFGAQGPTTSDGASGARGWIQNSNTKYVRIYIDASANGIDAEGFMLGVRNATTDETESLVLAESGTLVPPPSEFTKVVDLSDNVKSTVFTFAIPTVTNSNSNVSVGFEVSYVIRCSRVSSTRTWRATYGKVYGAISRGWENDSNAVPVISITTTDQALASTDTAPTITWEATLDSGTDNAAKNGYLAVTVDNPIAAINTTKIAATIKLVNAGTPMTVS